MAVKKNILEQYGDIRLEIKDLERRITDHKRQIKLLESETMCDVVKDSKTDLRYGTIRVEGIAEQKISRQWELIHRKMEQLQKYKKKLEDMAFEVEDFIETMEDSNTRRIARYRYIDGYTWIKVAICMGPGYSDDYCRHIFNRYFKKHQASA